MPTLAYALAHRNAIAAVAIGGTSLFGGVGTADGTRRAIADRLQSGGGIANGCHFPGLGWGTLSVGADLGTWTEWVGTNPRPADSTTP